MGCWPSTFRAKVCLRVGFRAPMKGAFVKRGIQVLFLQKENETNQGIGEWKKVGSMGMDKEYVQCSALWHWIKTHYQDEGGDQVLQRYLKDGICGKIKMLDAYIKPHPVCQFK